MSMNDRIQLDGKMYIPLSAAMETSGMSEASLRSAAASGQLWLRAAGKKVYVELESLRRLMDSQAPVVVQTALEPTPVSADIPSYVAPRTCLHSCAGRTHLRSSCASCLAERPSKRFAKKPRPRRCTLGGGSWRECCRALKHAGARQSICPNRRSTP